MSIDYGNPPRNFIEEYRCDEPTAVMCDCGRAMVLVNGNDECPVCDAIPSAVHKDPKLYQAGTHPAFPPRRSAREIAEAMIKGHWMGRVMTSVERCEFDECEEHTKETTVPSMVELVGGAR